MRSNNKIKEILDEIDVEDFLAHLGVDYRITPGSSGTQANIRECPRCGGTSWKVYINVDGSGLGNCFHGDCVSEAGYNLYTFAKALLGSGKAAFEELEQYYKLSGWVPIQKRSAASTMKGDFVMPHSFPIPINGKNLKYLSARGISIQIAEYLNLRYSKDGKFPYSIDGKNLNQSYANRIIIPIFNIDGQMVTFQGRDITGHADKKYLFPPGLAGSGRFVYNAHNVIGLEEIILCEGAFDVAAVVMAIENTKEFNKTGVVGSFGKHLSMSGEDGCQLADLISLRDRGLKRIVIMWDGERLALEQACKVGLELRGYGFAVRIAILPEDKDPNEVEPEIILSSYYRSTPVDPFTMAKLRLQLI
ncbi:MAG: hypothetical protein ABJG42_24545 [Vibrio splendidus]